MENLFKFLNEIEKQKAVFQQTFEQKFYFNF